MNHVVRQLFRVLIAFFCGLVLCQVGQAQQPSDLSTKIDAIQKQEQLILDKLNELESRLPANGTEMNSQLPVTTEISGEDSRGEASARIAVIEYGDFECPFCGQYERDSFPKILQNYIQTGKIKYLYRDLPLHHPHAMLAARASHCAGDQSKYWEMHDALFASQSNLVEEHLSALAGSLGLDATKFANCLASDKFSAEIQASISEANKLGMSATPSFVIGTLGSGGNTVHIEKRIVGAIPYDLFKTDLDELLVSVPQR